MRQQGRKQDDDGTLEVEIHDPEEDLFMEIGKADMMKIQESLIKELDEMTLKSFEENKMVLATAKAIEEVYHKRKTEMGDEIKALTDRFLHSLKLNHQYVGWTVQQFRKTIREVLMVYVEVNNRMKHEEKMVIKQDAFIAQVDKNVRELKDLRDNIRSIQTELFDPPPSTAVAPSTITASTDSASESNRTDSSCKPIETESASQIHSVNKAMEDLKRELPMCAHLPRMMEPIQKQGNKVAKMALENQGKSVQEFVETLPPKKQD